jgi:hypothetical protein
MGEDGAVHNVSDPDLLSVREVDKKAGLCRAEVFGCEMIRSPSVCRPAAWQLTVWTGPWSSQFPDGHDAGGFPLVVASPEADRRRQWTTHI